MVTKDLGLVTAYAYAVSKGYTGTEEEFAELMASYASVAQDAANAALASAQSAQSAQTAAQSAQSAQTAAEGAKNTAQATVSGAIAGIQAEGQTQIGAVQSEGTSQVGNVNSAGQTQVGNVNAAGATQVGNVNTAGSTQVSAIQAKGDQIIASLPEDYTEIRGQVSQLSDEIDDIGSDVTDLKSAINDLDKTYTGILPFSLVNGEYVENGTGAFKLYGGWSRTDYIDLTYVVDFTSNKASNYSAFYDENKEYVKDIKFTANQKIDVPENVAYLVVSGTTSGIGNLVIACTKLGVVKTMQNAVDDLNGLVNSDTYIYPETIVTDAYINANGTLTTNASGFLATPYIPLPFNETQNFQIRGVIYGNASCAIYDEDYTLLLAITGSNVSTYGGSASGGFSVMTIPYIPGMKYARLSARSNSYTALTDLWAKGNTIAGAFKRIASIETDLHSMAGNISTTIANSKVLVIGDSISTDAYGSYKKWVTDLKEAGFFPADTVNSSQHATGFVARYNSQPNDFITRVKAIENPSEYDLVIVFGGINDYIQNIPMGSESGTDYTVSFKPAVNEFFNYLIQNFTQARLCVLLPLRTYATWQNSVGEYQQAYGDYIKTVAKSYCLPVLNLTEDSGFCPYIATFSDMWTLQPEGYQSHDGVHPNEEYERRFLAPMIKHFLQGLM